MKSKWMTLLVAAGFLGLTAGAWAGPTGMDSTAPGPVPLSSIVSSRIVPSPGGWVTPYGGFGAFPAISTSNPAAIDTNDPQANSTNYSYQLNGPGTVSTTIGSSGRTGEAWANNNDLGPFPPGVTVSVGP